MKLGWALSLPYSKHKSANLQWGYEGCALDQSPSTEKLFSTHNARSDKFANHALFICYWIAVFGTFSTLNTCCFTSRDNCKLMACIFRRIRLTKMHNFYCCTFGCVWVGSSPESQQLVLPVVRRSQWGMQQVVFVYRMPHVSIIFMFK